MRRVLLLLLLAAALTLAVAAVALAATPQDVYNDYLQHGALTGNYSASDLQGYLGDAGVRQYGNAATLAGADAAARSALAGMSTTTSTTAAPTGSATTLSSTTSTSQPVKGPAVGSSLWWVWVLTGIVAAALLGGGWYALAKSRGGSKS